MSDVHSDTLPPSPSGDGGAFEIQTGDLDFDGALTGSGAGGGNRQKIMIAVVAVLGVVLVVFLVTHVLHKSGSPSSSSTQVTSGTGTGSGSSPGGTGTGSGSSPGGTGTGSGSSPGGTGASGSGISGTSGGSGTSGSQASATPALAPFQVYTSRDPFVPMALPIGTGNAPLFGMTLSVTTTTVAVPAPPATAPPVTSPGVPATTTPTTQAGQPSGPPPSQTHVFDLISVFTSNGQPTANVTVDGSPYQVFEGEVFDGNFTVVSLDVSTSCGTFLYADYEFELCSGQQAVV